MSVAMLIYLHNYCWTNSECINYINYKRLLCCWFFIIVWAMKGLYLQWRGCIYNCVNMLVLRCVMFNQMDEDGYDLNAWFVYDGRGYEDGCFNNFKTLMYFSTLSIRSTVLIIIFFNFVHQVYDAKNSIFFILPITFTKLIIVFVNCPSGLHC